MDGQGYQRKTIPPMDKAAFDRNFDACDWTPTRKARKGTATVSPAAARKRDTADIISYSLGCAPQEVAGRNAQLQVEGYEGVRHDPQGNLHFRDRSTKLRYIKAHGYHDKDEVRG